jgi:hypothetical protein
MRFVASLLLVLPLRTVIGQLPPPAPASGNAIKALSTIDRGCQVYLADTLTLTAARERYGVGCRPVIDPKAVPLYGLARPARPYGRIVLSLSDSGAAASIRRAGTNRSESHFG